MSLATRTTMAMLVLSLGACSATPIHLPLADGGSDMGIHSPPPEASADYGDDDTPDAGTQDGPCLTCKHDEMGPAPFEAGADAQRDANTDGDGPGFDGLGADGPGFDGLGADGPGFDGHPPDAQPALDSTSVDGVSTD